MLWIRYDLSAIVLLIPANRVKKVTAIRLCNIMIRLSPEYIMGQLLQIAGNDIFDVAGVGSVLKAIALQRTGNADLIDPD